MDDGIGSGGSRVTLAAVVDQPQETLKLAPILKIMDC
ncbi:hypothetical protein T4C_3931 [Trichinella pseudospiralis]|uniref:Uncharacterized protein n=1 Tax=Trichinella pseudospiralis TaxID=6337 RepID=A0A0V1JM65_TRIPS|nr:hypothetical protein T4E_1992 [Trichinella pseudospiralis]KRY85308.1 hypothetical protein T4D_9684 [Trichinella pseudospiralis]KRZ36020.1 hypothetical protein T4C_3931 [Trichinella pseudospiralis]